MDWTKEAALPSSFDLFFDIKDYRELVTLYTHVCNDKTSIEELCITHGIELPVVGELT